MPWLKSASEFPENDKVWPISDAAYRLYDAMRHYAARKLTDGHVPTARVSALTPKPPKKDTIAELLEARLIHRTADICAQCMRLRTEKRVTDPLPKGGYVVHDYLHYNPPRWRWLAEQEAKKRAGKAGAEATNSARAAASAATGDAARAAADDASHAATGAAAAAAPRTPFPVPRLLSDSSRTSRARGRARKSSPGRREGLRPIADAIAELARREEGGAAERSQSA